MHWGLPVEKEQQSTADEKAKLKDGLPNSRNAKDNNQSGKHHFRGKKGTCTSDSVVTHGSNHMSTLAAITPNKTAPPKDTSSTPRMSKKEKECHFAEGLCLECHEHGHISCNCPKKQKAESNKKGKPPDVPMYRVTPAVGTSADLSALAEESGVLGTLLLAYVDFDCDSLPDLLSVSDNDTDAGVD